VSLGLRRYDGLLKLGSRKELEQLTEDAAESRQGVALRVDAVNREKSTTSYAEHSDPFVIQPDANLDKSDIGATAVNRIAH